MYSRSHRQQLGGYRRRRETVATRLPVPPIGQLRAVCRSQAAGKEMSTTMAFVRMLGTLLKRRPTRPRDVPIVADEARTFGMANLFKQVGIYRRWASATRRRTSARVLAYREALDGPDPEEGISEAGAIASWTAAATS